MFDVQNSFSEGRKGESRITRAIMFMIAKDDLPLNTVEKQGFKHLIKTLVPLYKCPIRKTITKYLDIKYDTMKDVFKRQLENQNFYSLTTDIWTETHTTMSYLGVTIHFIADRALQSVVLAMKPLCESHTSDYISTELECICLDWNIDKNKIVAVVSDQAANMVKAISERFGNDKLFNCNAHKLNLVVNEALNKTTILRKLINNVKDIVTFTRQSVRAADDLRHIQLDNNIKENCLLKLIQDCPTRWNSTFYMVERFISLSDIVGRVLLKNVKAPPMISALDIEVLQEVTAILSPFEQATKEFSKDIYVTASMVIPLVSLLKNKMEKTVVNHQESKLLLHNLKVAFYKSFQAIEKNKILMLATILDPRFKRLHVEGSLNFVNGLEEIDKELEMYKNSRELTSPVQTSSSIPSKPVNDNLWEEHDKKQSQEVNDPKDAVISEKTLYINQSLIPRNESPIDYWENSTFDTLKIVAKKYVSVVASSVPSERLFSKAGNLISDSRTRLYCKRFERLTFLSSLKEKYWSV